VIIEHDIPMVTSLADRLIAMESGRVLADRTPEEVRTSPLVVASYLDGDSTAIERSQCSRAAGADGRCAQHRSRLARR
jgi:ABC-type glutathione transport system ATPase component